MGLAYRLKKLSFRSSKLRGNYYTTLSPSGSTSRNLSALMMCLFSVFFAASWKKRGNQATVFWISSLRLIAVYFSLQSTSLSTLRLQMVSRSASMSRAMIRCGSILMAIQVVTAPSPAPTSSTALLRKRSWGRYDKRGSLRVFLCPVGLKFPRKFMPRYCSGVMLMLKCLSWAIFLLFLRSAFKRAISCSVFGFSSSIINLIICNWRDIQIITLIFTRSYKISIVIVDCRVLRILVQFYFVMLQLSELIKERIGDVHQIKHIQQQTLNAIIEEERTSHKRMPQVMAQIERKENQRLKNQVAALENLQSLSLSSEETLKEFMTASLSIFRTFCPQFDHTPTSNELPNMRVHRLYRQFLLRFANPFHFSHICSYLRREICELNAVIYLGWLGEWSRGLLAETLKKWGSSSEGLRLRTELSKMVRDRLGEERSKQAGEVFLHSRQNFYGYFLAELEEHYKRLEILDLDLSYLRSIKRFGRKEELLGINSNESINFIISKNNTKTAEQIKKYQHSFASFLRKSKKRVRFSSDGQNTQAVKLNTIKSFPSKQLIRQENIQNSDLLHKMKRPKKSKILLGSACQRIEFPLIQTVVSSKNVQNSPKTKKSMKKIYKTQPEQCKDSLFIIKNDTNPKAFFKKQLISLSNPSQVKLIDNCTPNQNILFQYNSIQAQFHHRRHSIIRKIQEKGIDMSSKGSKVSLPSAVCFDDHILKKVREGLFLSEKNCKS